MNCLTVKRSAGGQCFDNAWVVQRHADFGFARFVEAFEAPFHDVDFLGIENFQAHDVAGLAIACFEEIRHRAGNCHAQQLIARVEIDLAGKHRQKSVE